MKNNQFNNKGQGVMEYIIISSLVGIFCLVIIKSYGEVIHQRVEYMKAKIVKNIPANWYAKRSAVNHFHRFIIFRLLWSAREDSMCKHF